MTSSPAAGRSQSVVVVEDIKAMIQRGSLAAGDRLPVENDLAASLGVSRGSLREGVRALVNMGILETRQGDGTYVTSLDPALLLAPIGFVVDLHREGHAAEVGAVRRVLETEAVGRAALRMSSEQLAAAQTALDDATRLLEWPGPVDPELMIDTDISFHSVIARASGNAVLEAMITALSSRTVRTRVWRSISEQGAMMRAHSQHSDILDALRAGDPDRARLVMGVHLLEVEQFATDHPDDSTAAEPDSA